MIHVNYPIYLGVSKEFFELMTMFNVLDGDARFTISMAQAENDAKHFHKNCSTRYSGRPLGSCGPVMTHLFYQRSLVNNPEPTILSEKMKGVVIKFDTQRLMNHHKLYEFGDEIRINVDTLKNVNQYIDGSYEIVDVELLEPIGFYN